MFHTPLPRKWLIMHLNSSCHLNLGCLQCPVHNYSSHTFDHCWTRQRLLNSCRAQRTLIIKSLIGQGDDSTHSTLLGGEGRAISTLEQVIHQELDSPKFPYLVQKLGSMGPMLVKEREWSKDIPVHTSGNLGEITRNFENLFQYFFVHFLYFSLFQALSKWSLTMASRGTKIKYLQHIQVCSLFGSHQGP